MKRFALLAALLPGTLFGAINGSWSAKVVAPNPTTHKLHPIVLYATLSSNSGQLTGTAGSQGKFVPITNATITGSNLTFSIKEPNPKAPTGPPLISTYNVAVSGPNLVGTVTLFSHQTVPITLAPLVSH